MVEVQRPEESLEEKVIRVLELANQADQKDTRGLIDLFQRECPTELKDARLLLFHAKSFLPDYWQTHGEEGATFLLTTDDWERTCSRNLISELQNKYLGCQNGQKRMLLDVVFLVLKEHLHPQEPIE